MNAVIQYGCYLIVLICAAIPLGNYIKKLINGERTFLSKLIDPIEKGCYLIFKVEKEHQMGWKEYLIHIIIFSLLSLFVVMLILMCQAFLPFNPEGIKGMKWDLAFNTAVSFVTNTNWQAYSGEASLSYFSQAAALTVQNFVSAACGIAVLFVLIRGLKKVKSNEIGNFYVDMTRILLYLLIPLNLVLSLLLSAGGVIQNMKPAQQAVLLEPFAVDENGKKIEDAQLDLEHDLVFVEGKEIEQARIIKEQFLPMGPIASQVAIKQSGTNGGGFLGVNSSHPFENPNYFTNLIEVISILILPAALCFTFGKSIENKKQGVVLFMSMFICLVIGLSIIAIFEQQATTQLIQNGEVDISMVHQAGGNMEGKESRFGIVASSVWAAFTTAASNGSVNAMHDSFTPIGGMVPMIFMQLGEVIFGGAGCGLYQMISFVLLSVFVAGLMVGRTPEFLGKKIEPYEMKWAVLVCLATPIAILVGSGVAAAMPFVENALLNTGAHGFSEILYAYSSAGGNNGSAFAGLQANTLFFNLSLSLVMLFARFLPLAGTLAIAGSLAQKKKIAATAGTLSTTNGMFVFLLIVIVLLIGALSFLPSLALGPLAEFFESIR